MSNNQPSFEEMEIAEFSKHRSKNRNFIIMIGIIILFIISIPMAATFINSKFIEAKWEEKLFQIEQSVEKTIHIEEMVLKNLERLEMVDNRTKDFFAYTRVGNHFYLKLDKMTYKEGKEACHKMYGNMLEFDERNTNGYTIKLVDMISNFEIWNFLKTLLEL